MKKKHVKKLVQDSDCPLGELSFRWLLLASSLPKRRDFCMLNFMQLDVFVFQLYFVAFKMEIPWGPGIF